MTSPASPEGGGVLIARQPIFDRDLVVRAYQLIGQATDLADVFGELDPSTATGRLLNDVFLEMDIEALTGGRPVLVPATPRERHRPRRGPRHHPGDALRLLPHRADLGIRAAARRAVTRRARRPPQPRPRCGRGGAVAVGLPP